MDKNLIKQFNHFKIHSQYSICQGAIKIDDLKHYCKINKVPAIGLSDSSNLCGALEFAENISKVGTQPIIGTQINFFFKENLGFLPLIANNIEGYKKIVNLSSKSYLELREPELREPFYFHLRIFIFRTYNINLTKTNCLILCHTQTEYRILIVILRCLITYYHTQTEQC